MKLYLIYIFTGHLFFFFARYILGFFSCINTLFRSALFFNGHMVFHNIVATILYYLLFDQYPIDGRLDCFHFFFFSVVSNAAVNILGHFSDDFCRIFSEVGFLRQRM